MWKEKVLAWFKVPPQHLPGGTDDKYETLKLDWSLYTFLTQLYGGIDMYNLLHKEQLHVSALFIGHLQVDIWETLVSSYTRLAWVVYNPHKSSVAATTTTCFGPFHWPSSGWYMRNIGEQLHATCVGCIQSTQFECSCYNNYMFRPF